MKSDGDGSLICHGNCRKGCEENFADPSHLGVPHKRGEQVTEPSSGSTIEGLARKESILCPSELHLLNSASIRALVGGEQVPEARDKGSRIHSSTFLDPPLKKTILRDASLVNTKNSGG